MSLLVARVLQPALLIALVVAALALVLVLVILASDSAQEPLLAPFRWIGTGARAA